MLTITVLSLLIGVCSCKKADENVANDNIPTVKWLIRCNAPKDPAPVLDKVNEILVEKVGARLEIEWIDTAAYTEKMNTYMASSKYYDLAFAGAGNPLVNAASKGGIQPLDEYLKDFPELKECIPDYAWELTKYKGKIYGVPNIQVLPTAQAAVAEKRVLEHYGRTMSDFKSIDDMEPFFEQIKNEPIEDGFYAIGPNRNGETLEALGYCDEYVKADKVYFKQADDGTWKGIYKFETPEYKKQVERMYEFYSKGYIRPDILSSEGSSVGDTGVGFAVYKPGIETLYKSQGIDAEAVLVNKPVIEKCQAMTVLGKDAKHPVEALKILKEVNTNKELYNLLSLGIEGVHYEKVDENTYKFIGDQNTNTYFVNGAWRFGNQFNLYVAEGDDPDVWEQTAEYNESAQISPFVGFAIDDKAIRTELAQLETVISRYSVLYVGAKNPEEYYDDFIAELKKAGSDKVVAEYERQINEFMTK